MVISNAIICDATKQIKQDICIEDGVIKKIADFIDSKDKIDANGAYLLPALVDTNVRLKDSILNSKNIKQISKDAKEGGVGLVVLNADSNPAIDNEVVLEYAQNSLHNLDGAKIELMLNATQDDGTLSNIAILLKEGAIVPYMSTITRMMLLLKFLNM